MSEGASSRAPAAEPALRERRRFPRAWWSPVVVFVISLVLRVVNIGHVRYPLDDSFINVPNAAFYSKFGYLGPDNWWTQPLKHVLLYADIALFGNDPLGWRMRGVVFGAAAVTMGFLIARRVFRARLIPTGTALLMALNPVSLAFARTTNEDIPATFFILAAILLWVRGLDDGRDIELVGAGALIGLACATRWYAVIPAALMFVIASLPRTPRWHLKGRRLGVARTFAYLGVVPMTAYLASYAAWFTRGYSLTDLFSLHVDAYRVQATPMATIYEGLSSFTGAGRWFVDWVGAAASNGSSGGWTAVSAMVNNPFVWALFVPATAYLLWRGWVEQRRDLLLLGGCFVLLYGFFVTAPRPIALYSSLPVAPFGFMAVAFAIERVLKRRAWVALGVATAWGLYLYPLTAGIPVPAAAYGWTIRAIGGS